jgi:surfactin synthase thioesterase subunit
VAWDLAHELRDRAMPMPTALYVASSAAPSLGYHAAAAEGPDEGLIDYLHRMGGTPPAVLADPDLLAHLLPALRSDLTVLNHHDRSPVTPLDLPIRGFAGAHDTGASPERMSGWGKETAARFDLDVLTGGHFIDADGERRVIEAIVGDVTGHSQSETE